MADYKSKKSLYEQMRVAKAEGRVLPFLDNIISIREKNDKLYVGLLKEIAKIHRRDDKQLRDQVYKKTLEGLKIEELPEFLVKSTGKGKVIPLNSASSFRANLSILTRRRQLFDHSPELKLSNKLTGYEFCDLLGVRRPWTGDGLYKLENIPVKEKMVIKPLEEAGSRGVYLIFNSKKILDVKRTEFLDGWGDMEGEIIDDLEAGIIKKDKWMIEELILEKNLKPARDLKFYCFYGEVALVLEIQRFPSVRYCWWDSSGNSINTGKFHKKFFEGDGVTQEDVNFVEEMSKEIPTPFIRIDFLKSKNGLVFGEFTPRPGQYEQFNKNIDQFLGDCYLKAEGRLINDLYNGKQFSNFRKLENL